MQVPGNNVLDIVIDMDDVATQDIMTPTHRKEAGADLTDEEIEKQSGLDIPPDAPEEDGEVIPAKEPKASEYKQSAESIVLAVDFVFQTAVPFVFDFKAFNAEERRFISQNQRLFKKRKRNEDKGKSETFEFFEENEVHEELYQRWAAILDYCEDEMQLEEEEVKKLTTAWQRVLEFYKKQPGPWPNLIMALTAIYGKRTSSIFVV